MPEALSFTEIDRQHLELLPARTVMSMFSTGSGGGKGTDTSTTTTTGDPNSGTGGVNDLLKDGYAFSLIGKLIPLK